MPEQSASQMTEEMKFCIGLCIISITALALSIAALVTNGDSSDLQDQINALSADIKTIQEGSSPISSITGDLTISGNLKVQGQTSLHGNTVIGKLSNPYYTGNNSYASDNVTFDPGYYGAQFQGGGPYGYMVYNGPSYNIFGSVTANEYNCMTTEKSLCGT